MPNSHCRVDRAVDFVLYLNYFGIPGSGFRHIEEVYCAPLIIAEQLEQMIASLRQGHVDQTARSDAMCAGDDKTCPEFELHHRKFKETLDRERRSFLKSTSLESILRSAATVQTSRCRRGG